MRALLIVGLAALACLARAPSARAWDPEADRVVAQLAYERLTPGAKSQVDALLSGGVAVSGCRVEALDDSARLAECLHGSKDAFLQGASYDAIPLCGPVDPRRTCPDGRCASAVLKRDIARLKDPALPRPERVLALEAVAYLISELHQPLHTADNGDRSADRVRVVLAGAPKARNSLYSVWDNDLVADAIGTAETGLPYLRALAAAHGADWTGGGVDDWVAGSHDVALHTVYGRLPAPPACGKLPDKPEYLGPDYFAAAIPAVREQLAKAGVRLAAVLNGAFR